MKTQKFSNFFDYTEKKKKQQLTPEQIDWCDKSIPGGWYVDESGKVGMYTVNPTVRTSSKTIPVKLMDCKNLTLDRCSKLISLEGLPDEVRERVDIEECASLESLEHLPKTPNLFIDEATDSRLSTLPSHLKKLIVKKAPKISSLQGTEHLKNLYLVDAPIRSWKGGPSRLESLTLSNCNELEDLSGLEHVDELTVRDCAKLEDFLNAFGAVNSWGKINVEFFNKFLASKMSMKEFMNAHRGKLTGKKFGI
jgi:hypothetical protein